MCHFSWYKPPQDSSVWRVIDSPAEMCLHLPPLLLAVRETEAISHWLWVGTVMSKGNTLLKQCMIFPLVPPWLRMYYFPSYCFILAIQLHYCKKRKSNTLHKGPSYKYTKLKLCFVLRLHNLAKHMEFSWNESTSFLVNTVYSCICDQQLRPCPHLEQDVLSDCLSMQHLQSSTSSEHLYNGKDGRSPGLGQDIFTGARRQLLCHLTPW